ncbi:hypothetical protein PtB15_15B435 [Puccinia triticina]|nr:hypothetical protein PtB15_15B435 [Puccinia triticina]
MPPCPASPSSSAELSLQLAWPASIPTSPADSSTQEKQPHPQPHMASPEPAIQQQQTTQQKWKNDRADIRFALDQLSTSPEKATERLGTILKSYQAKHQPSDTPPVPLDGRLEVLLAAKYTGTSAPFFKAWLDKETGCMGAVDGWLQDALAALIPPEQPQNHQRPTSARRKTTSKHRAILLSILQLLHRLPLGLEDLKGTGFGSAVRRINKAKTLPENISKLSAVLNFRWTELVSKARAERASRAVPDQPSRTTPVTTTTPTSSAGSTPALPAVNPKPSTSASASTAQACAATTSKVPLSSININRPPAVESRKRQLQEGPSKPDNSYDAKKQKLVLPSQSTTTNGPKGVSGASGRPRETPPLTYAKRWYAPPSAPAPTPAPTLDPFVEALGHLHSKAPPSPPPQPKIFNPNRPPKRVRFKPDEELCQVKVVERVVYEADEYYEFPPPWTDDARMLVADEGRYLHQVAREIEEEMEWREPEEVVLPSETLRNLGTSVLVSAEALVQAVREETSAEVSFGDGSETGPETAAEPPPDPSPLADAPAPRQIKLGAALGADPEVLNAIAFFQAYNSADEGPLATDADVSDILTQLSDPLPPPLFNPPASCPSPAFGPDPAHFYVDPALHQPGQTTPAFYHQYNETPAIHNGFSSTHHYDEPNPSRASLRDDTLRDLPPHFIRAQNLPNHPPAPPALPTSPPASRLAKSKHKRKRPKPRNR